MKYLVLNWKMNPSSLSEAERLFKETVRAVEEVSVETVVCPPFVYLSSLKSSRVSLGAQDVFWEREGPYTGEVSVSMLEDAGCRYVLVGHSERRRLGETTAQVNRKLRAVLEGGLTPILFVGEDKKGDGLTEEKVRVLTEGVDDAEDVLFVYEPAWAVSTEGGRPLSTEEARRGRRVIEDTVDKKVPVLYGGSVDGRTAMRYTEFDGLAVGGASLDPDEVARIARLL